VTPPPALTVVTVGLHEHVPHLIANHRLQRRLSPLPVRWVVVDNDRGAVGAALDAAGLDVQVVDGKDPEEIEPGSGFGSYHHAAGLAIGIRECATRYLLVLDPDLYLVRPCWTGEVPSWMEATGTAFFGVPWHPTWYSKYRDFPSVHCMFVDTRQAPVETLDFTPELRERPTRRVTSRAAAGQPLREARGAVQLAIRASTSLPRIAYHLTAMRKHIGATRDTGYRIYEKYSGSAPSAVAKAVAPASDFSFPFHLRTRMGRALEAAVAPHRSYLPRSLATTTTFRELGAPDARRVGAEEFLWQEEPFAIHLRRTKHRGAPAEFDAAVATWVESVFV
jgi:hypothetical protein